MNPRDTLAAQLRTLLGDVQRERSKLDTHLAERAKGGVAAPVAAEVLYLLSGRLSTQADRLREQLNSLEQNEKLGAERESFRKLEAECRDLFGECLAVFTAEAIRALNLDGGACSVTERFMRGLGREVGASWEHLTALADAEFFSTASQIVRLRYPVSSIWDYPIAAHEFGHFAGPNWTSTANGHPTPYQNFLENGSLGSDIYLGEFFADMFATFALGPAYVGTCLQRRFDPLASGDDSHPSDRERAEWMLIGLEFLVDRAQRTSSRANTHLYLAAALDRLRSDWKASVEATGGTAIEAAKLGKLTTRARALWDDLSKWAVNAVCDNLDASLQLKADFANDSTGTIVTVPATVRDVLNAAWLLLMENEGNDAKIYAIEKWGETICMRAER